MGEGAESGQSVGRKKVKSKSGERDRPDNAAAVHWPRCATSGPFKPFESLLGVGSDAISCERDARDRVTGDRFVIHSCV